MIASSLQAAVAGRSRAPAAPHEEPAIDVAGLRKSYDGVVQALDGVDLEVRSGELLALLGTIVLTTHYMDEAQHLADRVAVIAHGKVIADGTPDALGRNAGEAAVVGFRVPDEVEIAELPLPPGADVERGERRLSLRTATPTRDLAPLLAWAAEHDIELEGLTVSRPSLEDVYLQLTEEAA